MKGVVGPLLFYFSFLFISHKVLPSFTKKDCFPLFTWRLFADLNQGDQYDLVIRSSKGVFFLTDSSAQFGMDDGNKIILWSLNDSFEKLKIPYEKEEKITKIKNVLSDDHLELDKICKLKISLEKYMLLTTSQKRQVCEEINI